jgi:hypothetical protein
MKRSLLVTAVCLAASASVLLAQQPINEAPPVNRVIVTHLGGVSIPPVYGAPFSATVKIQNEKQLADGSTETSHNINLVGRDSLGRTHGELRISYPNTVGMPILAEIHIFDPQTRENINYDLATHIVRRQVLPEPRTSTGASNPQVTFEDLGTDTIENFIVKGTRRTLIVPARTSGTGAPVTVVDEYWYSEDLHLNLLLHHNDPRSGQQTIAFTNIKRGDPPPSFFEIPAGYTIIDLPPPGAGKTANGGGGVPAR